MTRAQPYYRADLARVHHSGFGFHADACAPGVLALLEPVRARGGLVVELGCGSGLFTKHLVDAGHRVIATDASLAMLAIAYEYTPGAEEVRQLVLPDDPIPEADAIVSIGHPLSYLPTVAAIDRALTAAAEALRPGGVLTVDICDYEWGDVRVDDLPRGWVADDWALVTETSVPTRDRFVREMAIFTRNDDGSWRRDDERHDNVLIDTKRLPALLGAYGVDVRVAPSFGTEQLPTGLRAIVGSKRAR